MEKDESQKIGEGLLPPSGSDSNGCESGGDLNQDIISTMPETPPKNIGHRRVHSEIVMLLDDISFGSDLGIVGAGFDAPSYSETEEDLFSIPPPCENHYVPSYSDRSTVKHHQHSVSMDGDLSSGPEETSSMDAKKSMSAAKLAELALVDPKRAKRIWANRQSAVRSKERKMRYISELEREVQTLQTQATSLSAQLTLSRRDAHGLVAENNDLKLRLQAMEQQVHLQDVLNDALKKEVHHLRVVTGQNLTNGGPMMNFPPSFRPNHHQFHPNTQPMHTLLTAQQFHQLQIQSRMQQQQQHRHHQFQQQQLHQLQRPQHLHQFQHHPSPPQPPGVQPIQENSDLKDSNSLST